MSLAWDTSRWTNDNLDEFTQLWVAREFGTEHAGEIAQLISAYTKFNGRCKPELLDAKTYSLVNYREFETVVADYTALVVRAQKVSGQLAPQQRDAFYGVVLFPIKACAQLNAMYLAAAKNALYAKQGRARANDFAVETHALFTSLTNLVRDYNQIFSSGKWNHFMDQTFIGYTGWNDPKQNRQTYRDSIARRRRDECGSRRFN